MKTSQHTPGPWHRNIKPATKYNTIFSGRNTHVTRLVITGLPADEVEANCNLIAAAPDLLAALIELEDSIRTEGGDNPSRIVQAEKSARAAIAKATRGA